MKRWIALLLIAVMLVPTAAFAAQQYIIPDSDTRYLSETELWQWDYESLGYILNEIFARHGYNFIAGAKYDNYFRARPWYTPNADSDNRRACYSQLSRVEWANERLVKEVRIAMRQQKTSNSCGKHYLDYIEADSFDVLSGFVYTDLKPNQKAVVYSAPSTAAYRGANGKASVSTNGAVYLAGWENGWLLLMYATNNGAVRVGYVQSGSFKDKLTLPKLDFAYQSVTLTKAAALTDDPATSFTTVCNLAQGATVTYLTDYHNRYDWAYVETTVNGQTVRGFISADAVDMLWDGADEFADANG